MTTFSSVSLSAPAVHAYIASANAATTIVAAEPGLKDQLNGEQDREAAHHVKNDHAPP